MLILRSNMVDWGIRMCLQTSLQAILECNRIDAKTDFRAELPRINVPTLVIHGDADVSAPLELMGRRTASSCPAVNLKSTKMARTASCSPTPIA